MNSAQDHRSTISVIIPTHNRGDLLSICIDSILAQEVHGIEYEIIVVDNNSTDNTKQVVDGKSPSNDQLIRYVKETKAGLVHGRHRGIKEANGDLLVFCDDDIIASSGWLQSIYEAFKDPKVALVGGKILPKYSSPPPSWIEGYWVHEDIGSWIFYLSLIDLGDDYKEIPANYVFGANLSIRKKVLQACHGFHPDAFPREMIHLRGDGEYGLAIRIMKRGYLSVYHPGAVVRHMVPNHRMTPRYFIWRSFCQGISDSFTKIREDRTASSPEKYNAKGRGLDKTFIELILSGSFDYEPNSELDLKEYIQYGYNQGMAYHRHLVNTDPKLYAYVVQATYLSNDTSLLERSPMQADRSARKKISSDAVNRTDDTLHILRRRAIAFGESGNQLFAKCLYSKALEKFNEAMYLFPNLVGLQYMRAKCLQSVGRLREADLALQSELAMQPGFEPALRMRSNLKQTMGLQDILAIPTKVTFDERLLLYNLSAQVSANGVIVEVGSYIGSSSCFLAEGSSARFATIYCIDTWQNDAMPEAKRDTFEAFTQNTLKYKGRMIPLRGESTAIASDFSHEIDMLFIDADHSYAGCKSDIEAWLPKLKQNGIIVFHDYGWSEGIQRAVGELIKPIEVQSGERVDSIYWTRVNKKPSSVSAETGIGINNTSFQNHHTGSHLNKAKNGSLNIQQLALSLYTGEVQDLSWVDKVDISVSSAVLYITDSCNSRCNTCTSWQNKSRAEELNTAAWKEVLRDLRSNGILSIEFVGGEPLLRKDLPELAAFAKSLGFTTILLSTNGFLLDQNRFSRLVDSGINSFHISLDGILSTYERIRGVDWYDKVVSACQMISEARMPLMILTNLVRQNIDELELIAAFAHHFNAQWFVNILENRKHHFKGIDIDQYQIIDQEDIHRAIKKLNHIRSLYPQTTLLQKADINYIEAFLSSLENEKDIPCTLGFNEVYLDAKGNLYPACMSLPAAGDVLDLSCASVLASSSYRSKLKAMLLRNCPGCTCGYSQRARLRALADSNEAGSKIS